MAGAFADTTIRPARSAPAARPFSSEVRSYSCPTPWPRDATKVAMKSTYQSPTIRFFSTLSGVKSGIAPS